MLDTVKLQSPKFGEDLAREIERSCVRKSAHDLGTGELLYELTSGSLTGSYDHRVSVRVMREEWREIGGRVQLAECRPYVLLEGSAHKAMLGHNISAGPESVSEPCEWLCEDVAKRLGWSCPALVSGF